MPKPLSPTQQKVKDLLEKHGGNQSAVARELGLLSGTINKHVHAIRDKGHEVKTLPHGANGRHVPALSRTPEEQKQRMQELAAKDGSLKGVSTLYNAEGEIAAQWVKSQTDKETRALQVIEAAKDALAHNKPIPVIKAPRIKAPDLLNCYCFGDPHLGLYSWKEETGADFDLDIAEELMVGAMQYLVSSAPPSDEALIVNVGDFFHADNASNMTMRSGHVLDVDTRWAKVLRVGIRAMRACIEAALEKHKRVRVINEIGNHDDHTSQVLTIALEQSYERNKRVTFDMSPARYHYHRFGKCLIGVTHGDQCKPTDLAEIMAADRPQDWGETEHRYWFTGHIHTKTMHDLRGCDVRSFRTLAASDAWAHGKGYRSRRDMQRITLHRLTGEESGGTATPQMFMRAAV